MYVYYRLKPAEVMTFLNDLWLTFDSVIDALDVYKVDTIGERSFEILSFSY